MNVVTAAYVRVFEPFFKFGARSRRRTTLALRAARIPMFPEWYLSLGYLSAGLGALACAIAAALPLRALSGVSPGLRIATSLSAGAFTFLAVRMIFLVYPRVKAAGRARAIDAEFPSVVMMSYALARGGVPAPEIFRAIAQEEQTYGEISREFGLVLRDIEQMGQDMNSALLSVASTTPSATLKAFFEGLVTIMNSGADPRDYFKRQAAMQLSNAELRLEKEVEQAGLLAESYVSGLLVLPLLLVVILSVLSVIGSGGTFFITLVIFALVPGGTFAYLVLVDMLVPPDSLDVPPAGADASRDFGADTSPPDVHALPPPGKLTTKEVSLQLTREVDAGGEGARRARWVRRFLFVEWARRRLLDEARAFVRRALAEPLRALQISAPVAFLVGSVWAAMLIMGSVRGASLGVGLTQLLLVVALIALIPVGIFHELRVRRGRKLEAELPETLSKLSGFNERGVSLLRSFQILGKASDGAMAAEFRSLERDVSWTHNLRAALARMRARVETRRLRKVGILFERGSSATGNLKEVLEIAAAEAATNESQRARKAQAMMSYTVVIYVVFAVFLYVLVMVTSLFYGEQGFGEGSFNLGGVGKGLAPETARLMFFQAAIIQGAGCGFVAGKLGEGRTLSGIKHAAILCVIAWVVFALGVL